MGHNAHPEYIFNVMKMDEEEFIEFQSKLLEIGVRVKLLEETIEDALEENEDD